MRSNRTLTAVLLISLACGAIVAAQALGSAGTFQILNASNSSPAVSVSTSGIGSGISVQLPNASNGARAIDVSQLGVGPGVFASSTGGSAIWGVATSISAAAVLGDAQTGEVVVARGATGGPGVGALVGRQDGVGGYGVRGFVTHASAIGVLGQAGISGGVNVAGRFENVNAANTSDVLQVSTNNTTSIAFRSSTSGSGGVAGRFEGNVTVTGTLTKGAGAFRIDHPLDPDNKYLLHSFVESPDMKNVYDGVAVLDVNGEATVNLPDWFQALNRDFRYQLTAIGAPGPNLYIAQEVAGNRFRIAGGAPGKSVSWQVTGIRHDAFAEANRIPVEQDKPAAERGLLLHPAAHGFSLDRGIDETAKAPMEATRPGTGRRLVSDTPARQ